MLYCNVLSFCLLFCTAPPLLEYTVPGILLRCTFVCLSYIVLYNTLLRRTGARLGLGVLQGRAGSYRARVGREDGGVAPLQVSHRVRQQGQPDETLGSQGREQPGYPLRPQEHRYEGGTFVFTLAIVSSEKDYARALFDVATTVAAAVAPLSPGLSIYNYFSVLSYYY